MPSLRRNGIGLSKEIQDSLLNLMDIAAVAIIEKESRRIARCLVDEGLSPEKINRITGCDVENFYSSTTVSLKLHVPKLYQAEI